MARKFKKISLKQFQKDTNLSEEAYQKYQTPQRSTKYSAGYDFTLLTDITLKPSESKLIPTGIKVVMNDDEVLMIYIRSSLGCKYNIRLCNQTGIIDKDYYNNQDNEGHIFVKIQNTGKEKRTFKQGEKIVQGIFIKYLVTDDEQTILNKRKGGFGSTNKEVSRVRK